MPILRKRARVATKMFAKTDKLLYDIDFLVVEGAVESPKPPPISELEW